VLVPALIAAEVRDRVEVSISLAAGRTQTRPDDDVDDDDHVGTGTSGGRDAERSRRRRVAPLVAAAVVLLVLVLGAALVPRMFGGETQAASPPLTDDGGTPPGVVALGGPLGDWQIPRWDLVVGDQAPTRGASVWRFDGACTSAEPCALTVVSNDAGPDALYTPDLALATLEGPPRIMRLAPGGNGFTGTTTYSVSCDVYADIAPETWTDAVGVKVLESVLLEETRVATRIGITWTTTAVPGPEAIDRGCVESTTTYSATGTRLG
jgi:hypothetical protein